MRRGVFSDFASLSVTTNANQLSMQNRKKILDALAEASPQYADILFPSQRKQIHAFAVLVHATAPRELVGQLQQVIDAMSRTACEGLCRYRETMKTRP